MKRNYLLIVAIISLIILYIMMRQKSIGPVNTPTPTSGSQWTVYGTMGCGWTRKQLEYMKNNGKSHTFVDCDNGGCSGMEAYPTLISADGEKIVGYKEV